MKFHKQVKNIAIVAFIILVAATSRLIPHLHNFSPLIAMSVFGAAYLKNTKLIWWLPLAATFLSDIALHFFVYSDFTFFYPGLIFQYLAYGAIILVSTIIFKKVNVLRIGIATLAGALLFFLISNFGSWIVISEYSKNLQGLISAYAAGIPFFKGTFYSTLLFSVLLFSAYYIMQIVNIRTSKVNA